MSNPNEPTCFFGLTSVRKGTRFIATIQLVITTISIILTVAEIIGSIILLDEDTLPSKDSPTLIILLLVLIVLLCLMFPLLYLSYRLRKATSDRNVTVVKFWLVLYGMFIIISMISFFLGVSTKETVYGHIIGLGIDIYFMSVVFRFYLQEVAADGQGLGIMHA